MQMPSIAAQRIAIRFIAEKIDDAAIEARRPQGMDQDSFECFKGWLEDYCDFADWAKNEGYAQSQYDPAWAALHRLLGLK